MIQALAALLLALFPVFSLSGCNSAPSQNILGSFFPSWMLCAVFGIGLAIISHGIFVKTGVDEFIPAKPVIYLLLAVSLTFFTWLAWFGH
jgi:hypothetical protein